ncbi:CBS domain-containing protein [Candidatus Woesearchaeota archaeon]|nr:CBS domain-containing protein [Candidatus Woesearchaeota archaeon]
MGYEIEELRQLRRGLGLSQTELARSAGVSQSLIAKIESGAIDPTYSKVRRIFAAIDLASKRRRLAASDIMTRRIISCTPDDMVKEAIQKMRKHGISQMPAIDQGTCVGLISEKILLAGVASGKLNVPVRGIMSPGAPIVPPDAGVDMLVGLLTFYQLIVVAEKGAIRGVITRSDLLRSAYR